jgi:diguanylate cyclase (GGDEF)-like protein/PAS domain S-box-containing protein
MSRLEGATPLPSSDGTDRDDPWTQYALRTVRGGLITSALIIVVVGLYFVLPGHGAVNRVGCLVLVAVTVVLTGIVGLLPWRRLAGSYLGNWAVYAWAVVMVGIVFVAIAFTGGAQSELFLVLIVVTVFMAGPAYPIPIEITLTGLTIVGYVLTLAATGWGISAASLELRVGMLASAALAVGVLNHELGRALQRQMTERAASDNRVALWSRMAAVVREIDAPDVDRVLVAVVGALDALGFEASDICALDPGGATYRVLHARNLDHGYVALHHDSSAGMVGKVVEQRQTVVTDDFASVAGTAHTLRGSGLQTVIAGPVWVDGELAAILEAFTAEARTLAGEEIAAFEMLAAQAGHALENAHLLERQRSDRDHFRQLLESAPDAVVVADADHGLIVEVSNQAEELFGYSAEELIGRPAEVLMPERLRTEQISLIDHWLDGHGDSVIGTDRSVFGLCKDGTELPVEITFRSMDTPQGPMVSAAIRDITRRREFERRLAHQATHDRLTGLPNRELFTQRLARSLHGRLSIDPPVTVCLLDLDHFKYLNDSRGHRVGDSLVVAVAARIQELLHGAFIARVGGDEFGLLAEGFGTIQEASAFGERLLEAFDRPFEIDDIDCYVSASVGIAFGHSTDRAEVVLSNADAAVNWAKHNGRSRVEFFDEAMTVEAADRVATESQLHLALDRGEFTLSYQPVVTLANDRLIGMEALLRWHHPDRGMVLPASFIPTAEDTGLIIPIGEWVLNEACRQLAAWRRQYPDRPDFSISVNVSSRQLEHDHFVNDVGAVLAASGIPPRLLVLEITESFFIRDFQAAVRRLHALKKFGVRLAIDDFGTGFSSLFSLSRLPVDIVKIDKAFIDGLGSRYDAVVTAVVTLGEAFGLDVVAEGIEIARQRDRLIDLGCRFAQGNFFSEPLEAQLAGQLLLLGGAGGPHLRSGDRPGALT